MKTLGEFVYLAPRSVDEATSLLHQHRGNCRVLAGGTDLIALLRDREIMTDYVLDIKKIPELRRIEWMREQGLRIGAACTIEDLRASPEVKRHAPLLHRVIPHFANMQICNRATIGGNLVRSSPSGDLLPALLVMEAKLKIRDNLGEHLRPIEEFFTGPGQNILGPGQLVTQIQIPGISGLTRCTSFQKLKRTQMDLAKVNGAVCLDCQGKVIKRARVAVGAVAPLPKRLRRVEQVLENTEGSDVLWERAVTGVSSEIQPITDARSTLAYRAYVTGICIKRALQEAWEEMGT